jgi:peptidyl-prolyl cis-trans isomerase A (cyclophilin A)
MRAHSFGLILLTLLLGCSSSREAVQPRQEAQEAQDVKGDTPVIPIRIETTLGNIEIELYSQDAPRTVENFVTLTKKGFYDGIIFHRVIPNFMIQTGDPEGTGRGGPGYTFADEFSPRLKHDKPGVLSMANSGPNTNGSQFFITEVPTPWLDGLHSVFGQVIRGIDVVHQIANVPRGAGDRPLTPVAMKKVTVLKSGASK